MHLSLKIALGVAGGIGIVIAIGMIIFFIGNFDYFYESSVPQKALQGQQTGFYPYCDELLDGIQGIGLDDDEPLLEKLMRDYYKDCPDKSP